MSRNFNLSIGEFYHLYNRGNDKREMFFDESDYLRFQVLLYVCNCTNKIHISNFENTSIEGLFSANRDETLVDIGAYCLMPNHFHLLVKEKVENGISLFMQKLCTGYTMYFNKKYHKTGSLLAGTFKAKHLNYDQYLKYQFAYIHLNPVSIIDSGWKEKKLTNRVAAKTFLKQFNYSSYKDYIGENREEGNILNKSSFPDYFSSSVGFLNMINEWLNFSRQG